MAQNAGSQQAASFF